MKFFNTQNRQTTLSIFLIILVIIGGTFGYSVLEGYSVADGFYMTIITITTVGYGEIQPLSTSGRMFTSLLILFGFASIAFVGRTFAESFFSRIMSSNSEKKKMLKEISQLKSHYIICGFGRVGNAVADKLQAYGTEFVIIESDSENCQQLTEDDFLFIEGNAINDNRLESAGIKKAKGLLAILPSVADNLFITLTARELNPTLHIIARADTATSEKRLIQAGADIVISPFTSAGHRIAKMMLAASGIVKNENQSNQMMPTIPQWIEIDKDSELIGITLNNFCTDKGYKVLGLRRSDKDNLDPDFDLSIQPEDKLFVIENVKDLEKQEFIQRKKPPTVVIVDDNPVIGKLFIRLFRRAGFVALVAGNGEEALKVISDENPNAAVIDFQLPGLSGIDICKKVRKDLKNDDIKLVLFTSDDNDKIREKAIKTGADSVVVKSADASELVETVIGLLRKD